MVGGTMSSGKTVRVAADYDCHPVWLRSDEGLDNIAPADLPVSRELQEDLERWGDAFDATLDRDDPMASGFRSPQDEEAFAARGAELARRLRRELGTGWQVTYFDLRDGRDTDVGP